MSTKRIETGELIAPLHGLRGIAALTVLFGHLVLPDAAPALGVVLFFVLSGFLIGRLYLGRPLSLREIVRYAAARLGRVYPLFAVVVLLAAALAAINGVGPFGFTVRDLLPHLFLHGDCQTIWTVSVEFQFYGVFLMLWMLCARVPYSGAVVIAIAIFLLALVLYGSEPAGHLNLLGYLHIFFVGLAIAVLTRRPIPHVARQVASLLLPASLVGYALVYLTVGRFFPHHILFDDVAVVLLCGIIISSAVVAPLSLSGRLLSLSWMLWLGEVSFGMYLLHRPIQWIVERVSWRLGLSEPTWVEGIIIIGLTLPAAAIASRLIERPARVWLRALAEGAMQRRPAPAT